jgi:hypothetical protein
VLRFLAFLILFVVSLSSQATALPDWAELGDGWKSSSLNENRVMFEYKTHQAFVFVERSLVDFEPYDIKSYFKKDFKTDISETRGELLSFYSDSKPVMEITNQTEGDTETASVTNHFQASDRDVLVAEKLWVRSNVLWHVVFVEQSSLAVANDSHRRAIDRLTRQILLRSQSSTSASLLEVLVGKAFAQNRELGRNIAGPRLSTAGGISPQCLASGYDPQFLRQGAAHFDVSWRSLASGCKADVQKIEPALRDGISQALTFPAPASVPDLPACHSLKPRSIQGGVTFKTVDDLLPYLRIAGFGPWRECVYNERFKTFAGQVGRAAVNSETYRSAFRNTIGFVSSAVAYVVHPEKTVDDVGVILNSASQSVRNVGCLNSQAQAEAICKYAASAAAVVGAAACTVATRGRCAATLKAKLEEFGAKAVERFRVKARELTGRATALSDAARFSVAEAKAAKLGARLEEKGLAKIRKGVDCGPLNKMYPGAFPEGSRGCTAIRATRDIDNEFCGCGKLGKAGFNFTFTCPDSAKGFRSVASFSNSFTLPRGSNLDFCSRVKIPAGKECYAGSTRRAFDDVLAGTGGAVQLFCVNGISDRLRKQGVNEEFLTKSGLGNAAPDLQVTATRWSPFTQFRPYQNIVQDASRACSGACGPQEFKRIERAFDLATENLRAKYMGNRAQLERVESEHRLFQHFIDELRSGRRNPLPPTN